MSGKKEEALHEPLLQGSDNQMMEELETKKAAMFTTTSYSAEETNVIFDNEIKNTGPKKKNMVHKLKGYFRRRYHRFWWSGYIFSLLSFLMIFVIVNNVSTPESETEFDWCGRGGVQWAHDGYFSNCFLEMVGAYPIYFNFIALGTVWLAVHRPWNMERRNDKKANTRTLLLGYAKMFAAGLIAVIPDERLIAAMFNLETREEGGILKIIISSDIFRTLSWAIAFAILTMCFLRQVRIPWVVRQFSAMSAAYRVLWIAWVIHSRDANDARLIPEFISFIVSICLAGVLWAAIKYPDLEFPETANTEAVKKKGHLYWPTLKEQWDILGSFSVRLAAVMCMVLAAAEGVVRVFTFAQLGKALTVPCDKSGSASTNKSVDIGRLAPFFYLAFSIGFLRAFVRALSTYVLQNTTTTMKDRLFNVALNSTRFFINGKKAEINETIHTYLEKEFLKTLCSGLPEAMVPIVSIVTSIGYMFVLSWRLSILLSAILIFFVMFTIWRNFYTSIFQAKYNRMRDAERYLSMDIFNGFDAVQLYAQEAHERGRLLKLLNRTLKDCVRLFTFDILGDFGESQILVGGVALGVGYGAYLVAQGTLDAGDLASYGVVAFNATGSIKSVTSFITNVGKSRASSDRVMKLLKNPAPANLDVLPHPTNNPKLDIHLEKVWFSYTRDPDNPDAEVTYNLKDVTADFPRGKSVGLVGHTGCGKSTLIKLILREYNVIDGEGNLNLDEVAMASVSPRWLYSQIAYVPQKPIIFDESIFYNLCYGWEAVDPRGEISPENFDLLASLVKKVGLSEFLNPGVKERYVMHEKKASATSGGQQQRIAIVRALLRRPKLMILDEITSALDGSTEMKVMQLIREHARMENATTIIIAHRYATIRDCDEILVLKAGVVMERGTYTELEHKPGGEFQKLLAAGE